MHSGSEAKLPDGAAPPPQEVSSDEEPSAKEIQQKMGVQHYQCGARYETGCRAQWTGSHPWWQHGLTANGKPKLICSACQLTLFGWITPESIDTERILRASRIEGAAKSGNQGAATSSNQGAATSSNQGAAASSNQGAATSSNQPTDPIDVPVPMDVDDDL